MKVELSKKEIERLASAMLMYLFIIEDKRNCNCDNCRLDKEFSDKLLRKLDHILDKKEENSMSKYLCKYCLWETEDETIDGEAIKHIELAHQDLIVSMIRDTFVEKEVSMSDIKISYKNKLYYFPTDSRNDHTCQFDNYSHIPGDDGFEPVLFCKKDDHMVKAIKKEDA